MISNKHTIKNFSLSEVDINYSINDELSSTSLETPVRIRVMMRASIRSIIDQ